MGRGLSAGVVSAPTLVGAIAAVSRNGVMGVDGQLPWSLPREWRHFRETTRGGTLVLGRRCYEETGAGLAGCSTLVVTSRDPALYASDTEVGHAAATRADGEIMGSRKMWG
jgi:dihydrofolate reductase